MSQSARILLIDNYDSFTYNLYDYFLQLNAECTVIRNDEYSVSQIKKRSFDALVFSPGPEVPERAGVMMDLIEFYYNKINILGICLGHQALGEYFGAELIKAKLPMHGKTSNIIHSGKGIFNKIPQPMAVMRYHSLILKNLKNTPLKKTAWTEEGEIMALQHEDLPLTGVQFHPESIGTPDGLALLRNWLNGLK